MRLPSVTCYKGLSLVPAVRVLNLKMPPLLWAVLLVICSATYLTSQDALRSPHPHHTPEPTVGVLGSHGELCSTATSTRALLAYHLPWLNPDGTLWTRLTTKGLD